MRLPQCIFCPMRASVGCHDCKAPLCRKCAIEEAGVWKCRQHRKRVLREETVKGEIE